MSVTRQLGAIFDTRLQFPVDNCYLKSSIFALPGAKSINLVVKMLAFLVYFVVAVSI